MPLTDVVIRNAKPRQSLARWATATDFFLVQPSGDKLWRLKCRINEREKKIALGIY